MNAMDTIIGQSTKNDQEVVSLTEKRATPTFEQYELEEEFEELDRALGIPSKYRGTANDLKDMNVLGKEQVLRRNFRFTTMVGFASTVIVSWEILLPVFTFVLTDGGTALLFWGFIVVAMGMSMVYASIAEMASMAPTAGGQYHWVSEFAPPRRQKLLSYLVGWTTALGWQVCLASVCFMLGGIIQGLIALNNPSYPFHPWHATLLSIAFVAFAIIFNTLLAVKLPLIEGVLLVLHICGFFGIAIPLWIMASRGNPHMVLLHFTNNGGWPTTGLSAMIGLSTPVSAFIGYDCTVHMAEEIHDASITLPLSLMWGVFTNGILGFLMAVTLIFTLGDINSLLNTETRQPFIQLFYNATRSYTATNIMTTIIIIMLTACVVSELATASRQLWSFARDKGLPGSAWLSVVPPGWNIPVRSVVVSFVVTALLSCINLGSLTALNAINSLGSVAVLSSYLITISCLVWYRRNGGPLPARRWSLGKYGLAVNIGALCFLAPIWFFSFWPLATPVTAATMNWSSAMFGGVILFALLWYVVRGRHEYTGPVVHVKRN